MSLTVRAFRIRGQTLLKIALIILLIGVANFVAIEFAEALRLEIRPSNEDLVHRTITLAAAVYALLMAIPFVPGVEVGLALIALLGPPIVFLVYVCTFVGLSVSYLVGRLISLKGLVKLFEDLHCHRTSKMLGEIEPLDMDDRIALLVRKAPKRFVPCLLRHRYIALAIVFNLPGNFLFGGGGGVAMIAGVSKLYSLPGFLGTTAIAVAPVPLAIFVLGNEIPLR